MRKEIFEKLEQFARESVIPTKEYNELRDGLNEVYKVNMLKTVAKLAAGATVIFIIGGFGVGYLSRNYDVWAQEMAGKAKLAEATQSRQIAIEGAKAKQESATYEAEAEVRRAKGVAEANKIIGESLKNNESYLRYLWVNGLNENNQNVIYVPTEANMPILEAGKRP